MPKPIDPLTTDSSTGYQLLADLPLDSSKPKAGSLSGKKVAQKKEKDWNPTDKKTCAAWGWFKSGLKLFGSGLLKLAILIVTIPAWIYNKIGKLSPKKKFIEDFQKQWKTFKAYIGTGDETIELTDLQRVELIYFEKELETFSSEVSALANDPGKMRARIAQLSQTPIYLALKDTNHPAVQFLRDCGRRLESTDGVVSFSLYGGQRLVGHLAIGETERVSLSDFATALEEAQAESWSHRDHRIGTLIWGAREIDKLAHVEYAHLRPLDYDSYQGHAVFYSQPLEDDKHVINHKYTPGLTGPQSIVEGILIPDLRRMGRRWVHIDNQSTHIPDERARIDEVDQWAKANSDVFLHAVISTDTPREVAKTVIKDFVKGELGLKAFIERYEAELRGDGNAFIRNYNQTRGIYIPPELLDDIELQAAFQCAAAMVLDNPSCEGLAETPEGRAELAQIVGCNLNSVLSWAIMKKEQLNHKYSIFTENCKENIDRGPPENMGVILNDLLAAGTQTLDTQTAFLHAGIILGRAEYAMDRAPQAKRLHPFIKRTRFIDDDGGIIATKHLQKLRKVITGDRIHAQDEIVAAVAERLELPPAADDGTGIGTLS